MCGVVVVCTCVRTKGDIQFVRDVGGESMIECYSS